MSNGTTISDGRVQITEKVIDHGVDALCAVGIAATAYVGAADTAVIGGLVSIALGKRIVKK